MACAIAPCISVPVGMYYTWSNCWRKITGATCQRGELNDMATYYHANGGGNGGGNDRAVGSPIIVLFCIPTPVTWIIALIWLASKLRGGGKRGKTGRAV